MTTAYTHPLEGDVPPMLYPEPCAAAERNAAAQSVLRWAGTDEDAARTVLTALGLIEDPLHKPTKWTGNK